MSKAEELATKMSRMVAITTIQRDTFDDVAAELRRLEAALTQEKELTEQVGQQLGAEVQRLETEKAKWLKENSPGGWIDGLRVAKLELLEALKRIRQWDMLDAPGDGPFWKRTLDELIAKHGGGK